MPEFSTLSVEGCIGVRVEEEEVHYYTQQCGLVPRAGFLSLRHASRQRMKSGLLSPFQFHFETPQRLPMWSSASHPACFSISSSYSSRDPVTRFPSCQNPRRCPGSESCLRVSVLGRGTAQG